MCRVCSIGVPAHAKAYAPVLSAPVHFACHAALGAAYRRRGGTVAPHPTGRSRAIPRVRRAGRPGHTRHPHWAAWEPAQTLACAMERAGT